MSDTARCHIEQTPAKTNLARGGERVEHTNVFGFTDALCARRPAAALTGCEHYVTRAVDRWGQRLGLGEVALNNLARGAESVARRRWVARKDAHWNPVAHQPLRDQKPGPTTSPDHENQLAGAHSCALAYYITLRC